MGMQKILSMNKMETGLGIFFLVLLWSVINPKDYLTWILETAPALIAVIVLIITRRQFPLTSLAYILILIHSIILIIGAHYTYAEVPLFNWLKEAFNLERNNYDKIGHFAQGFVPAIIAREIIIRKQILRNINWLNFFIICICLAISAFYELIEWCVALVSEQAAQAFLGTQGYIWDTQSDMAFALFGAIAALVTLSQLHNRQISQLKSG
ncbi:Inner membrane protein YjdF [Candidatus Methylobacter favarea]|uniref:Inner membrane protein YjdF n=2 Tax=Candidatus Methylobacter favarea TaxID=2707345 RepID=A0A8S0X0Y4_9GAMM|nr:Inner membrane protein YjdF [Candidatus Methylobacter favarea]